MITAEKIKACVRAVLRANNMCMCRTDENTMCPTYLCPHGSGLSADVEMAVLRAHTSNFPLVVLLPVRTHTALWQDTVLPQAAILFLPGRVDDRGEPHALACFMLGHRQLLDLQIMLQGHLMIPDAQSGAFRAEAMKDLRE
jgi:hypothetical protein